MLDNSDAEALVFHTSLGDRVARVMERAPNGKADYDWARKTVEEALEN